MWDVAKYVNVPRISCQRAGTAGPGRGIGQVDLFDNVPKYVPK